MEHAVFLERDSLDAQVLKLIAVAATGTDNIDLVACRQRGIVVSNIRDYAVHTVPEHVFALILALRRNLIAWAATALRSRLSASPGRRSRPRFWI